MTKLFRQKPVERNAAQFFEDKRWPVGVYQDGDVCVVRTPHGDLVPVRNGDWIVDGPEGAVALGDEEFRQLWEPVKICGCGGYCTGKGGC